MDVCACSWCCLLLICGVVGGCQQRRRREAPDEEGKCSGSDKRVRWKGNVMTCLAG